MKIASRFTVAVHTLLVIHTFGKEQKTTSDFIAASVQVKAGSGGATIVRDLKDITLYDVYRAVDSVEGDIFHFHENPNPACPVGKNIHAVLDTHLADAQAAMENELKKVTLFDLTRELDQKIC